MSMILTDTKTINKRFVLLKSVSLLKQEIYTVFYIHFDGLCDVFMVEEKEEN